MHIRLVNNSQQWRYMRGSQETRWLWISSSRGRKEYSLLYQEHLPLVVPRQVHTINQYSTVYSCSLCYPLTCISLVLFRLIFQVLCSRQMNCGVKAYRKLPALLSMMHSSWPLGERSMEQKARCGP